MRIEKIRFKNLNSLVGQWEIDLTHPDYAGEGIFAITGPTGAGKTTVLDALCVALYGQTPRLGKITQSSNEIMSRQTGECFAEVTFATQTGRYRCQWSQQRSHKKVSGELQQPKHEIADANSGKILESKLRTVGAKIENITGMDFDRFTQSMLLAQGGFAAFLHAQPDERAPILEQITGTEIYSQISVKVHERRGREREIYKSLEAELSGLRLLPEDEETHQRALLHTKQADELIINSDLQKTATAIDWLERLATLAQEKQELEQNGIDWQLRHDAFAPDRQKLNDAMRALELEGDHATLNLCPQVRCHTPVTLI